MSRLQQRISLLLVSCWLTLSAAATAADDAADTGWLVYELKFTPDAVGNLNFQFYTWRWKPLSVRINCMIKLKKSSSN